MPVGVIAAGRRRSSGGAAVANEPDGVVTILQRTSTQSISNSTVTAVSWSSAVTDSLSAWSSGSPTIVTVPSGKTGVEVTFHGAWADNSTANRAYFLSVNSTRVEAQYGESFDRAPSGFVSRRYTVTPGDTLKVEVFQDTGGALNFYDSAAGMTPYVEFKWFA